MKKIVANFKMNLNGKELKKYIIKLLAKVNGKNEIILCPPFTSLSLASFLLEGHNLSLGAQNICDEEEGSCTGEISGRMVKDCGCDYVVIGHSERKTKFKEN